MEARETIFLGQDNYKPYVIYDSDNKNISKYTVCVPKDYIGNYRLYLYINCRTSLDTMLLRNEKILKDDGIVVIPNYKENFLNDAAIDNDDKLFNIIYKDIIKVVNDCRSNFMTTNIDSIDILIDGSNDFDFKFYSWLEIKGYDKWFKKCYVNNPKVKKTDDKKKIEFKKLDLNNEYQHKEYKSNYTRVRKKHSGFSNTVILTILLIAILIVIIIPLIILR